jgi:ABC-type glycerol-3-phosphate transport system permease component
MPTKTEQADLLQVMFGRNSDSPLAILAPATPAECFSLAIEAWRLALKYMTPVIYLSDESKYTIAVALSYFSGSPRIGPQTHLLMAATTIAALPSIVVFLLAQRYFIKGIAVSGVSK